MDVTPGPIGAAGHSAASITLDGIRKRYPDGTEAVRELSLEVKAGELVVLIGPSGCGKSTVLRMVNRLIEPTGGRILLGDEDITRVDPVKLRRRIGYVIQNVGLFRTRRCTPTWVRCPGCSAGRRSGSAAAPTSCWNWSGSTRRSSAAATRTSSPVGSGSGSGWPGRSPPTRWCC